MAWLTGWGLRKSHVINPSAGAGTLYPVKIIVHKTVGDDLLGDVYLGTHVRDDFKDVRFTDNDGETVLDCFMESYTSGSVATFWVEVADDLSSAAVTIYIYYDKAAETTIVSNAIAANIFQLREHKSYASYNPVSSWSIQASTRVQLASSGAALGDTYGFFVVPRTWLHGKYLRFNWQGAAVGTWLWAVYVDDGIYLRSSNIDFPSGAGKLGKGAGRLQTPASKTTTFSAQTVDVLMALSAGTQDFVTIFFFIHDGTGSAPITEDVDWLEINTAAGGSGNLLTVHFTTSSVVMELTGTTGDYGLARKYIASEPAHSTWGTEEAPTVAPTVTTEAATGLGLD